MAETYKNARLAITNSEQTLYTNSSGGAGIIVSLIITNIDGSADDTVTVKVRDNSASADTEIASTMTVPADSRLDVCGDNTKVFLENGDSVKITGGAASGDLIALASILEIT
tara:strand:- start:242 stop:577 length:336 start_codon:yes stop_codon:yes gene_type:complete